MSLFRVLSHKQLQQKNRWAVREASNFVLPRQKMQQHSIGKEAVKKYFNILLCMMGVKSVYSDPFDLVNADIEQILIGMKRFAVLLDKDKVAKE